jgi:hypothetical protein
MPMTSDDTQVDKTAEVQLGNVYGTITVRVVVLTKKMATASALRDSDEAPADLMPDEILPDTDKRPVSSFLEEPKRGRNVCVFLINGQRQHAWDNQFIVRDLELKYLRNRMLIVVDCDGLKPEAVADLMQGSRHQFYEGKVYSALEARVLATLKGDPDLRQLEEDAEDEIATLQAGDEAVKAALDQLIDWHHDAAAGVNHGRAEPGTESRNNHPEGPLIQTEDAIVKAEPPIGPSGANPILHLHPEVATIRLKPNQERRLSIRTNPESAWRSIQTLALTFDPPIKELQVVRSTQPMREDVGLTFAEPEDFDSDEYPIESTLRWTGMFSDAPEPRLLERRVVITSAKEGPTPPRPEKPLLDDPTYVRVTSRQPIRIVIGGPDVHVKLRWDGKDELVSGSSPDWVFRVSCESPSVEPQAFLTSPVQGRFELLIQAAPNLTAGEQLKFDVEVLGPGKTLSTAFLADVVEAPSPRRIVAKVSGGSQRRPPYELRYVTRDNWEDGNFGCFGEPWSAVEPGSFEAPSAKSPLTIFINQDTDLLTSYRDGLLGKKLAETTIQQRINKYTAHVAFHLYQMYETQKAQAQQRDASVESPPEIAQREEIQRVAHTLIRLMEVAS